MSKNATLVVEPPSVNQLLSTIEAKLQALEAVGEGVYKTDGLLPGIGDIKTMTNIGDLVAAYASLDVRERAYNAVLEQGPLADVLIGLTVKNFYINQWPATFFKDDIIYRIKVIRYKEEYDNLVKAKEELKEFMTREDKMLAMMQKYKLMPQDIPALTNNQ